MIVLELPLPPSMNHYWRSNRGRTHISREGKEFRDNVLAVCVKTPLQIGGLAVSIVLYPPDKRRRDLDNVLKPLLDALQHAGVYEDDSQIDRLSIVRGERRKGGGVLVAITELE